MAQRRKTVGRTYRTAARGTVRVEQDADGHQWVTCSGCRREMYAPGPGPAAPRARKHAESCTR